jgi:ribosomal protein S12 methylthiotransferase
MPDMVLRSTFLVGFPGESEADFATLLRFQEEARLDWLGAFTYSREEGTAAERMKGKVPLRVARERKKAVEELQEGITRERMERFVGRELEVLVEENVAAAAGSRAEAAEAESEASEEPLSLGRAWLQAPEVDGLTVLRGSFPPGSLVRARVLAVAGLDLDAAPLSPRSGS